MLLKIKLIQILKLLEIWKRWKIVKKIMFVGYNALNMVISYYVEEPCVYYDNGHGYGQNY